MRNEEYHFTKSHTQLAKGIAIILMVIHHLFRFPDRLHNVSYISIIPFFHINNINIEFILGEFGKICVAMYLFLSGYGLYISYLNKKSFSFKKSIKKMISILINYWVIFIIFVPIGLIWYNDNPQYNFKLINFIANFFTLRSSYNYEWWFLRLYIELLLLFPIIKHILKKKVIFSIGISIFLYIISIGSDVLFKLFPQISCIQNTLIYSDIQKILIWQIVFCTGCLTAKYNLFKAMNEFLFSKRLNNNYCNIITIVIIMAVRISSTIVFKFIGKGYETNINATDIDFLLVPIFILCCTNIFYNSKSRKILLILGKHSTNIWLTHTFFAYYYFQKIVFFPKLSVLILIWLLILSMFTSIIIDFIISKIDIFGRSKSVVSKSVANS